MNIHFIGIEGVSMRVLARIAAHNGHRVTGSDITTTGHGEHLLPQDADAVVYTSAIPSSNPELKAACRRGLQIFERAEFLGMVAKNYRHVIAVGGSHGKTTCTGMLGEIFRPLNATLHIGGETDGESGHIGGNEYFITEACEYRRSFLHIKPETAVVLNAELDHTDYYIDLSDITDAFETFACSGVLKVLNADDCGSRPLFKGTTYSFGIKNNCDYCAGELRHLIGGYAFNVYERGRFLGRVRLKVEGRHNVYNALAAIAVARAYRLKFSLIKEGLEKFTGARRRFERVGCYCGSDVFTDYAHHPSEIKSTVDSARDMGYDYVTVVFEPHTYTRTQKLLDEFTEALSGADEVLLAPLFPAREPPLEGVSSHTICRNLIQRGVNCCCKNTFFEVVELCRMRARKGRAIIFTGAGVIDRAARLMCDEEYF